MHLKNLTLKGFKSFADQASIDLEPGVTVVVGPNGSGKSNVVDAIAWVLGAQAPSAVRSGKMDDVNRTTAILTVFDNANAEVAGTWLASLGFPQQKFDFQGKEYSMEIRRKRYYYPFDIKLLDFSHDRYLGTNIPMNFSSDIELNHPDRGEKREFLIYMNHPLRYDGLTFFQSGFANEDTTTILQVVSNPGRHLPYISCILIFLGLSVQFGIGLLSFTQKRLKKS